MTYPPHQPDPPFGNPQGPGYGPPQQPPYPPLYGPPQQPPGYGSAGYPPGPGTPPAQPPPWWVQQPPQPAGPAGGSPRRGRTGLILSLVAILVAGGVGAGLYFALHGKTSDGSGGLADTDTADPCSLVTAADVKYLNADVQIQPTDFNSCTITVAQRGTSQSDSGTVDVTISVGHGIDPGKLRSALGATAPATSRGPLHILEQSVAAGASSCEEAAYQDDGLGVTVTSALESGSGASPNIDLCMLSDHVTGGVADTVTQRKVTHLSYPNDSLGGRDLCSSVGTADAAAALPIPGMAAQPSQTRHACAWSSGAGSNPPGIVIYTKLNTPAGWADEQKYGSSTTTIAGRQTVITKSDAGDTELFCIATVAVKKWNRWPGRMVYGGDTIQALASGDYRTTASAPGLMEEVNIGVTPDTGGTTDQACQAMQSIAGKLWPALPPGN